MQARLKVTFGISLPHGEDGANALSDCHFVAM
jgi:hypothetical protein